MNIELQKKRLGKITASEIHKLIPGARTKGLSDTAQTYLLEKIGERLTGVRAKDFSSQATEWGVLYEQEAKEYYELEKLLVLKDCDYIPYNDHSGCTPDGFVGNDGLIEAKCPFYTCNHIKHHLITDNQYFKDNHKDYYWQVMFQLMVTKREWCDFVSYDPRISGKLRMFVYRVYPDKNDFDLLNNMLQLSFDFMAEIENKILTPEII